MAQEAISSGSGFILLINFDMFLVDGLQGIGRWDERRSAFEEVRELDFEEPSELSIEDAELSGALEGEIGM
jgi:hypothetical protein